MNENESTRTEYLILGIDIGVERADQLKLESINQDHRDEREEEDDWICLIDKKNKNYAIAGMLLAKSESEFEGLDLEIFALKELEEMRKEVREWLLLKYGQEEMIKLYALTHWQ